MSTDIVKADGGRIKQSFAEISLLRSAMPEQLRPIRPMRARMPALLTLKQDGFRRVADGLSLG